MAAVKINPWLNNCQTNKRHKRTHTYRHTHKNTHKRLSRRWCSEVKLFTHRHKHTYFILIDCKERWAFISLNVNFKQVHYQTFTSSCSYTGAAEIHLLLTLKSSLMKWHVVPRCSLFPSVSGGPDYAHVFICMGCLYACVCVVLAGGRRWSFISFFMSRTFLPRAITTALERKTDGA